MQCEEVKLIARNVFSSTLHLENLTEMWGSIFDFFFVAIPSVNLKKNFDEKTFR